MASSLTDGFVGHINHASNDVAFLPHFAVRLEPLVPLTTLQHRYMRDYMCQLHFADRLLQTKPSSV